MFGIGMPELIIILFVALIVIGPNKLPELAKSLGRAINEFKKATQDITDTIDIKGSVHPAVKPLENLLSHDETKPAATPETTQTAQPVSEAPGSEERTASDALTQKKSGDTADAPPENNPEVKDKTPGDGIPDGKD